MEGFLFFQFNMLELILIAVLFLLFLIQIFFYSFYYRKPLSYLKRMTEQDINSPERPSVSVIITTKENSEDLAKSLPLLLNQDYPNYEVIVVNNGYTEETDTLIKQLKLQHPHLYDTFLPYEPLEKKTDRRKLALTIGIKAAKNDILLFTEADSIPCSNQWISSMMHSMQQDKDVVLGYCYYTASNKSFRRIAKFDNLLYSLQYLSSAILHNPFTGIYRNVAYRKKLFFENKGFSSFLNYEHPEDLFLNYIMNSDNTAISISENSFVTTDMERFGKWKYVKRSYYTTKRYFRNFKFASKKFALETISRYLFYLLFIFLLIYGIVFHYWSLVTFCGLLFILKLSVQLSIINKSSRYFRAGKFYFSFIILELLQPVYNFYFRKLASKHLSEI